MQKVEKEEGGRRSPLFGLRGVGKSYGVVSACRDVSFDLHAGDVVGLAGENGAGKSTAMKCLAGWVTPTHGHIERNGERVDFSGPRDAERAGVAVILQEIDRFPELPVYENVFAGMSWPRNRAGLLDRRRMKATAAHLLARLGATLDANLPVKELSPADQKMVEIARALNRDASLLIMDEPTAALTDAESRRLFRVVDELRRQGKAIIHITHRLDEIFDHCSRIVVLRDGRVTALGAVGDIDMASLIKAMVGRPVQQFYERRHRGAPGDRVLEARNLTRRGAYHGVTFELHAGEILGFAGLIGAGRTEIAHAIVGVEPADSGAILAKGEPASLASVSDAMARGIAYLPEERRSQGLHLDFPIAGNMSFGALSRITRRGFVDERSETRRAEAAARAFAVRAASLDMPVGALSGGNQQKVLLAKVLADDPDIVILDEPTRGVDVGAKSEIYGLIEALAKGGKGILLISSEMEEVLALSDRIATVFRGRITRMLTRAEVSAEAIGHGVSGQVRHV